MDNEKISKLWPHQFPPGDLFYLHIRVDGKASTVIVNFFFLAGISCASPEDWPYLITLVAGKAREMALHTILQRDDMALATVGKRTRNPTSLLKHRIQ
jgi:hypothetical protein